MNWWQARSRLMKRPVRSLFIFLLDFVTGLLPAFDRLSAMDSPTTPTISSFILRFVVEAASVDQVQASYRGAIRHIQSAEEINFSEWREAVEFIRRFVPLEEANFGETQSST